MAPIFASADIAALLHDFAPAEPSKGRRSLFRTRSGNGLLDSRELFNRLDGLLNGADGKGTNRVKVQALPDLLQVQSSQQVLDCYEGVVRFSRDKRALLTHDEFDAIMDELQNRAKTLFVEMANFAVDHDISMGSIDEECLDGRELRAFHDTTTADETHIASARLMSNVKNQLQQSIAPTSMKETDISSISAGAPLYVLQAMVADEGLPGELEMRNRKIVYVPRGYREKQSEAASEEVLRDVQRKLDIADWVYLPGEIDIEKLRKNVEQSDSSIEVLKLLNGKQAAVKRNILDDTLQLAHAKLSSLASLDQSVDTVLAFDHLTSQVQTDSKRPDLAALLPQSQYRQTLEATLAEATARLDVERRDRFMELFRKTVLAPLQLYSSVDYRDATLQEHQEGFLGDHIANTVLPEFLKAVQQQKLLQQGHTKSKSFHPKDLEPFTAVSQVGPRRLTEVRETVAKFAKKHKIPNPDAEIVHRVQRNMMQQQYTALLKKQRPSDVLQHVIWIVLAQATRGVCVSAGKNTSRMIEQYKAVGNPEIWQQLVKWRDLLKAGEQKAEDLDAMKELASIAVSKTET